MDPKLKAYFDKQFKSLATKKDLNSLKQESKLLERKIIEFDKKIDEKNSDVLEVIRNVGENVSHQIGKIDLAHSNLRQHMDHIFNRINYLEKKILK